MRVLLIRHACAGRKSDWDGSDADRPLDEVGRQQADDLLRHLDGVPLHRLLASPTRRCVETVAAVGASHGIEVERSPMLAPDADPAQLVQCITAAAFADAALCTHGETLTGVLSLLRRAGTDIRPDGGDEPRLFIKGSVWTLTVETGDTPRIIELAHAVPSAVESCAAHPDAGDRVGPSA